MNGFGTSLLWGAVQVSLFCVIGAVVYALTRRRGPSASALVALVAILLVLGVSILSISPWPRWWDLNPALPGLAVTEEISEPRAAFEDLDSPTRVAKSEPRPTPKLVTQHSTLEDGRALWQAAWAGMVEGLQNSNQPREEQGWRWPALLACILVAGMAIGLVRLVVGLAMVNRYRRFSCPVDDTELLELLAVVRAQLSCTRSVAIYESAALDSPAVVGWLRPLVLLPETWRNWTEDERRAVLAHEVAHVLHNDYAGWLLAQLSLIVNFYNPLVHWLVGRLRIEQELAADGCGARVAGGNPTYLTILAGMALRLENRQASWAARPFLPARGTFLRRIEMLRNVKTVGQPQLAWVSRVLVIGALTAAALLAASFRAPVAGSAEMANAAGLDQPASPLTGEFIPPGAVAAVAIRVPDLLRLAGNNVELRKMIDELPPLKEFGIGLDNLDEVKVAVVDLNLMNGRGPSFQFFARTIKPFDWLAAIRKGKPNLLLEIEYNGTKYFKVNEPTDICIYMPDDRSIVGSAEARIRDLIQTGGKAARPTWADGWDKVAGGQVAAMLDVEAVAKQVNAGLNQAGPDSIEIRTFLAPLWDNSKVAFVGINLDKKLVIKGMGESRSNDAAKKVSKNLQALATFAENGLEGLNKQMGQASEPEKALVAQLSGIAKDLLEHVQVNQQGAIVTVQTETDKLWANAIASLMVPAMLKARESAKRTQSANNMKQIALAMHGYHDVYKTFPPAAIVGPDGKTTHSWRIALLPYLEQNSLYQSYKLDEPWDSANNLKVLAKMPRVFKADPDASTTASSYFVLTGKDTIFPGTAGTRIADITDGTSNTILIVEAKHEIPWTKPVDLEYDAKKPLPKFGGYSDGGFNAAFADGSVRFMSNAVAEQTLRALITKAGGEIISAF